MSEKPTIGQWKQNIQDESYKAYKCTSCGAILALPSGVCYACGGSEMEWTNVSGKGKLVSFTVIHIAPDEFAAEAPYYIGIVELEEDTRITCRLKGFDPLKPEDVKLGTPVVIDYEHGESGKTYLAFRPA